MPAFRHASATAGSNACDAGSTGLTPLLVRGGLLTGGFASGFGTGGASFAIGFSSTGFVVRVQLTTPHRPMNATANRMCFIDLSQSETSREVAYFMRLLG